MSNRTIKILCLHGLRHNSQLLKKSMESTIKKLSKLGIEFDFFDSPIKYCTSENTNNEDVDYRQWWSANRENALTIEVYDTIKESLQNLKHKWESSKYDGLLGFSQGSVLVQIFAYQIQNKIISTYDPNFLILVSSSPISDTDYKEYYKSQILYKTLIMSGSKDPLVDMNRTTTLIKYFKDPEVIIHSGGHYFSTSSEAYQLLKNFLLKFTNC